MIFHLLFRSHGQTQPAVTLFLVSAAVDYSAALSRRATPEQDEPSPLLWLFSNYSRVSFACSRDVGQKLNINAIFGPANCLEFVTCTTCRRSARPARIHSNQNGVTLTGPPQPPTPSFNRQRRNTFQVPFYSISVNPHAHLQLH